eukprot:TRINITY_DN6465_c0_g2_i1.p1 TRINITY_DN6465_c0_g2~~TRINITY_DN6465_c0_g2_i1.p1  ORF type:complete len:272 (+),score=61.01 TRINITY_DN6465_c0_g2_i1:207-1022(+)
MRVLKNIVVWNLRVFLGTCATWEIGEQPVLLARELRALHAAFDGDGDGKVSVDDVGDFWRRTNLPYARATVDVAMTDADGDGKISFDEFSGANFAHPGDLGEHELMTDESELRFRFADNDNDGLLARDEFITASNPQTSDELCLKLAEKMVERKDKNKDLLVEFDEFVGGHEEMFRRDSSAKASFQDDFSFLDVDGNKKLTAAEMVDYISGYDAVKSNVAEVFKLADSDSDGFITADELVAARRAMSEYASHHELRWLHELMLAGYHLPLQ